MITSVVIRKEGIGEDPLTAELGKGTVVASRYEVLSPLGNGVFKAHDRIREETVALRILRWGLDGQEERARRFREEIERACKLRHGNVGALYEYGETTSVGAPLARDGTLHYVAMELVEGVTLPQLLRDPDGLSWDEAFEISAAVADGVQAARDAGLAPLDLQPHNIVRDVRGTARMMGVGRELLRDAEFVGTGDQRELGSPTCRSPERLRGETADHRDVWSLAVLVVEIFAGRPAFQGERSVELAFKSLAPLETRTLEGAAVPPGLIPLLWLALHKDPAKRVVQTARSFAVGLRSLQARSGPGFVVAPAGAVRHRSVSWRPPTLSRRGRHMLLVGVTRPKGSADAVRRDRIVRFLTSRGYAPAKAPAGQLAYRRGTWAGSLSGFNPKRWQARVTVEDADSTRVRAVFDMNTTLQTVVDAERHFWVEEMNGLLAVIEGREPPSMLAADRRIDAFGKRALKDIVVDHLAQAIVGLLLMYLMYFLGDRLRSFFDWLFD